MPRISWVALSCLVLVAPQSSSAQEAPQGSHDADVANKLANPLANMVSIPLQSNFELGLGASDGGFRYLLNVQPVIPFAVGDWTVINRVIFPFLYLDDVVDANGNGGGSVAGMGDTNYSLFFAPPPFAGVTIGFGPAIILPTSTNAQLGAGHPAVGPTVVGLWTGSGVTLGMLASHVWSITDRADDYSQTFLQPFVAYVFSTGTSLNLQTETTYEWISGTWTVPLIAGGSQVVRIGPIPFSFGLFGKWYVEHPLTAPDWGLRGLITAVLPTSG